MGVKTFQKNRNGASTYTCGCCNKVTRETGEGESGVKMCAFCYLEGGLENSLQDGHITQEEFDAEIADMKKHYGRA